ncbi:MAG: sugar phosphate nucleotidyltransferase [Nitrospinota bacterium]|nr:sugar phosphate nucleotidyltransferase [Nitrospinota bacterium]MDH5678123.1 sugar phosphate nucleotidyltransferase [Nitrospinota bacterium]MDH5757329.1 sugar phosphate nucleotidyltransferase [Nitrospinota bacterium]
MIYSVIMAGGKGTRFWPVSRESRPKQFLPVVEKKTMIQATLERTSLLAPPERTLVVIGAEHESLAREQLPSVPPENIIVEPVGRNTAPCVALAAAIIHKRHPGAIMAVFPADHVMAYPQKLKDAALALASALETEEDKLATIGIAPAYPETGYGYIRQGKKLEGAVHNVQGFTEKPDMETAKGYLGSGEYLWNSGMFFWKTTAIRAAIEKYAPELASAMKPLEEAVDTPGFVDALASVYPTLPSISIDYAIMEKGAADGLALVASADPGWSDVGSWRSLYDLIPSDTNGNRAHGELISVDSTGLLVHNTKRLVAAVGVRDLIVVETDDAILILDKEKAQDVRQVIEEINRRKIKGLL